jgi:hypothetical protein
VLDLPRPARDGWYEVATQRTLAMVTAASVTWRHCLSQALVAWQGQPLAHVHVCSASQRGKRLALGPPKGENMAARLWHVHTSKQGGLWVLTDGGGVVRLVVRWQGEAMMSRGSVGRTMMAS